MCDAIRRQLLDQKSQSYEAGEAIYEVGEPGGVLYVVAAGRIELIKETHGFCGEAREAGDFFGEATVFSGSVRAERAVAVEPTQLLPIPSGEFEMMCRVNPEIGWRIMKEMSARLEESFAVSNRAERGRPSVLLLGALAEAVEIDERGGLRVNRTLKALSEAAGMTMNVAHRAVHALIDRKRVSLDDEGLTILDPSLLAGIKGFERGQSGRNPRADGLAEGAGV